eukprot:scaffold2644_cov63-Phaeocystis_antarctica.AAC.3
MPSLISSKASGSSRGCASASRTASTTATASSNAVPKGRRPSRCTFRRSRLQRTRRRTRHALCERLAHVSVSIMWARRVAGAERVKTDHPRAHSSKLDFLDRDDRQTWR